MTDADRDRLSTYLRTLADRMGLRDWTIEVLDEPADDGAHAEIRCPGGRKFAELRFDRDWRERTPEVLRHTCCHELIHCHHAAVEAEMRRRLNKADFATFMMLHEYAIDGTADAWAPCLPLMLITNAEETQPMGRQKAKAETTTPKTTAATPKASKPTGKAPTPKGTTKPAKKG